MTRVKICGIGSPEAGLAALEAGADMLGFIFYPPSHRYVTPERAAAIVRACRADYPEGWKAVGVFVNVPLEELNRIAEEAELDLVQLAGEESPDYCARADRPVIKVVRTGVDGRPLESTDPGDWQAWRILLDTDRPGHYGGTGEPYDWAAVRSYAGQVILAGGLAPASVARAIELARPWGVDVSSGVEREKVKDPELIRAFLREVKSYDRVA
jgi:phosphoribosylanthranilate isomerase